MKELSIEEKAKAYDEAIAHAKILLKIIGNATLGNLVLKNEFENMFPELKGSEDERIREELISFVRGVLACHDKPNAERDEKYESWIAWLEEQKAIDVLDEEERGFADNVDSYRKEVDAAYQKGYNEGVKATLEKQGEQEHDDKVEPKFHKGDWVINTITKEVEQVIELTDTEYICSGHLIISFTDDGLLKRWTIQDAKDGDVLAYPDGSITLFKYMVENIYMAHVLLVDGHIELNNSCAVSNVHPATKEQRGLLFQKMHEAGYEWDAEKKELKKKLKENPLISLKDFQDAFELKAKQYNIELPNRGYDIHAMCKELYSLLIKQKPAWSEENDEKYLDAIEKLIIGSRHTGYNGVSRNDAVDWIKSLRPQKPLTNEEIEQAKKEYRDVALSKMDYIPEELTYDNGWDDAISYIEKVFKTLYLTERK